MDNQLQSPSPPRRPRRWLTCLAAVLLLLAIATAALLIFLSASRTVSDSGVRTRLTRDWETVAAAASQVGGLPAVTSLPGRVRIADVVNGGGLDEYVVIANDGGEPADVSGWYLRRAGGPEPLFRFPDLVIQPWGRCRVYTHQEQLEGCAFNVASDDELWDDRGTCLYLHAATGAGISDLCYDN